MYMYAFPRSRRPDPGTAGQVAETILCDSDGTVLPFEPAFIRPLPPLHSCTNEVKSDL